MKHFLTSYSIELNSKDKDFSNSESLQNILLAYFDRENAFSLAEDNYIQIAKLEKGEKFSFCGLLKSGEFGYTAELINVKTGLFKAKQTIEDAPLIPIFFYIYFLSETKAILILQKAGNYGIKVALENSVKKFINDKNNNYSLKFTILQQKRIVDEFFKKGNPNFITLTTTQCPNEITEIFDDSEKTKLYKDFQCELKIKLTPPLKQWYNDIINKIAAQKDNSKIKLYGNEVQNIKTEIKYNGRSKVFCLNNLNDISIDMELKHDIIGDDGHPIYEKIKTEAINLVHMLNEC